MPTLILPTLIRRVFSGPPLLGRGGLFAFLALCLALLSPPPARAQDYAFTTLHNFSPDSSNYGGSYPVGAVVSDGQGHLYGVTMEGGVGYGIVYEYDIPTGKLIRLVDATALSGYRPSSVTLGDGHLYVTASEYIYDYDLASRTASLLLRTPAFSPNKVVLDGQGHLYATAQSEYSIYSGYLFEYDFATQTTTTLHVFGGQNAGGPTGGVALDGQGHIYGTTYYGGASNQGRVFVYDIATHALTTVASSNYANGSYPVGDVTLDGQGHLYGTTTAGGAHNDGTVYKVNLSTHALTTLHAFQFTDGANPQAGVTLDSAGHLFGTTSAGGDDNDGTVYKLNLTTRTLTTLKTFHGSDGYDPRAELTLNANGGLYGTTYGGGGNGTGKLFELIP